MCGPSPPPFLQTSNAVYACSGCLLRKTRCILHQESHATRLAYHVVFYINCSKTWRLRTTRHTWQQADAHLMPDKALASAVVVSAPILLAFLLLDTCMPPLGIGVVAVAPPDAATPGATLLLSLRKCGGPVLPC